MKRKLSIDEIKICRGNIRRIVIRNDYVEYLIEYTNLMLNKGLKHQEMKKISELNAQEEQTKEGKEVLEKRIKINKLTYEILRIQLGKDLNDLKNEREGNKKIVSQLEDQIKNGVEIKEKNEEKKQEILGVG